MNPPEPPPAYGLDKYASQNPPGERFCWSQTYCDEMKLFLGFCIAIGVHRVPQLEDYWYFDPFLGVLCIVQGMTIDRFKVIL